MAKINNATKLKTTNNRWFMAGRKIKKLLAITAVAGLVGGAFVVSELQADTARAATVSPSTTANVTDGYVWGEDFTIDLTFKGSAGSGQQYNVSAGVVLPAGINVLESGDLGTPITYEAGEVLPAGIVSGTTPNSCEDLGLETATTPPGACQVPQATQYLVYQNISDLPEGASASHQLVVRPDASQFTLGEEIPYQVNVYTSSDERLLPVFPGSTGVNSNEAANATSNTGVTQKEVSVNGLRITKTQTTHPENEVLRGVHNGNGAIYELRIRHTGETDIANATVTDYLPAGLEYLGSCDTVDSTTNANGTQQSQDEYLNAGAMNTASGSGIPNCFDEVSVETVKGSLDSNGVFTANAGGQVYTKVVWDLGTWEQNKADGTEQDFPDTAGVAAETIIQYRAGIPLYENELFEEGTAPTPESRKQGANLDNNTGPSTRQGTSDLTTRVSDAKSYTNRATAAGTVTGGTPEEDVHLSHSDSETVEAMDVRIIKSAESGTFEHDKNVRYTLDLATSEYVGAELGFPFASDPISAENDRLRLVDDMADGLCPIFGPGTEVFSHMDHSVWGDKVPNLVLGTYNWTNGVPPPTPQRFVDPADWNAALAAANVDPSCMWDWNETTQESLGHSAGADASTKLEGALLSGVAFDPASGRFLLEYTFEQDNSPLAEPNSTHTVKYTVHQNSNFIMGPDVEQFGATSSRDSFDNEVEINARTTPIDDILGVGTPGMDPETQEELDKPWNAWDDSHTTVHAGDTSIDKKILERGDVPDKWDIWKAYDSQNPADGGPDPARWVDAAQQVFNVGDKVWYRIVVTPPTGTDVRNPIVRDFLPKGVAFSAETQPNGRHEDMWIVPGNWENGLPTLGTCVGDQSDPWNPTSGSPSADAVTEWLNRFVPTSGISLNGNVLTFNLGAKGEDCGVGGDDRFLPFQAPLEIYLLVTVTEPSAFGEVDLTENLVKYQQENNQGEIWFLRDEAKSEISGAPRLIKSIRGTTNAGTGSKTVVADTVDAEFDEINRTGGYKFNTDKDGAASFENVVQKDEVTFRLDVSAPLVPSTNYKIWDALPEGISKEDLVGISTTGNANEGKTFTSAKVFEITGEDGTETLLTADWTAVAYNPGDTGYPEVKAEYEDRTIIVWEFNGNVPASVPADDTAEPAIEGHYQGISLGYTITIPDGTGVSAAAEITQRYENDASIVEYGYQGNYSADPDVTTPINQVSVTGPKNIAKAPDANAGQLVFNDQNSDLSDPSRVFLPGAKFEKALVETEIKPFGTDPADPNNTTTRTGNVETRPDNAIVQGEYVTFAYTATIPANTSVTEARIGDLPKFIRNNNANSTVDYEYVADSAVYERGDWNPNANNGDGDFDFDEIAGLSTNANETDEFRGLETLTVGGTKVTGVLLLPDSYHNNTDFDQKFRVSIKLWVKDRDASHPQTNTSHPNYRPNISNNTTLRNTAAFDFKNPNPFGPERPQLTDSADVLFYEPNPSLAKTVVTDPGGSTPPIAKPGSDAVYTLTATNANNRPALYDGIVWDCVPDFLKSVRDFVPSSGTVEEVSVETCDINELGNIIMGDDGTPSDAGTGTLIKWTLGEPLAAGTPQTLQYTASVKENVGGGQTITNGAHLLGYTLPSTDDNSQLGDTTDRRGDWVYRTTRDIKIQEADIAKSVNPEQAPVGETIKYTLKTTFKEDANYYNVKIEDQLPAGIEYVGNPIVEFEGWPQSTEPSISSDPDLPTLPAPLVSGVVGTGQTLTWNFNPETVEDHTAERIVTITFDAKVTDEVTSAKPENQVKVIWNAIKDDEDSKKEDTATAELEIINPAPTVTKLVNNVAEVKLNPDKAFTYSIEVRNEGDTAAHKLTIVDEVPAGVIVDPTTITPAPGINGSMDQSVAIPGELTGADTTTGAGGIITWADVPGPLAVYTDGDDPSETIKLGYDAKFIDSAGLKNADFPYTNEVDVTRYESFEEDGWIYEPGKTGSKEPGGTTDLPRIFDDARATPVFPHIELQKTVTDPVVDPVGGQDYGIAVVGKPFSWTLKITNTGEGKAQDISVTDVLPKNWNFVADSAKIKSGPGTGNTLENPTESGTVGNGLGLLWTETMVKDARGTNQLGSEEWFEIEFQATPTAHALTTAGSGVLTESGTLNTTNVHQNLLSATAKDTQGKTENGDGKYVGPDSTADAYIAKADLELKKTPKTVVAGTTEDAGWTIKVENLGPDTSVGTADKPIRVTDLTGPLPAGITVGQPSGDGWTCDGPDRDDNTGATSFECVRTDLNDSLAKGASFPVINVPVTVAADVDAGTEVVNTAHVHPGETYDPNYDPDPSKDQNNRDVATLKTSAEADLAIEKVLLSPPQPGAGLPLTWQLTVRNEGPSKSVSTAEKPITITDIVPDNVNNVTASSNDDWGVSTDSVNGFPANAGDTITWTYKGSAIAAGGAVAAPVTLTGTIDPDHTGDLTNFAVVHPGETLDPNYVSDPNDAGYKDQNNYDDVTTGVSDTARLEITKSRVVPDGSGWIQADPQNAAHDPVAGDPVHYRVTVKNIGPAAALGVQVVDEVPTGLSYSTHENIAGTWDRSAGGVTSTSNGNNNSDWDTYELQGAQLPGDDKVFVVTYDTDPSLTGEIKNWVEVTSENWDPTDAEKYDRDKDDTGSKRIVDLGIVKTHTGEGPFTPGTAVEYELVVTNHGPSDTPGVITVKDTLPAGMSYVTGSANVTVPTGLTGGAIEPTLTGVDDRILTWTLLDSTEIFELDKTITIKFKALIDPQLRNNVDLRNFAEVTGTETEPDPDPNRNWDDDLIRTGATEAVMTVKKEVEDGPWIAGTNVTYTLTVENEGPSAAPATVTDVLPTGLTLVSMSGTSWDCDVTVGDTSASCDYLDETDTNEVTRKLHPVGTSTLTVEALIGANVPAETELINEVLLSWTDDNGSYEDDDEAEITVSTLADLGIVKQIITEAEGAVVEDPATVIAGSTAWYRLQVTNYGPSDAVAPVTVTDTLPVGVTVPETDGTNVGAWVMTAAAPDITPDGDEQQTVTFTLSSSLAANTVEDPQRGIAPVIEFEVNIDQLLENETSLVNHATVKSDTPDPNPENDEDEAEATIERLVDVSIVKSASAETIDAGDTVAYTLTVENVGPSVAYGPIIVTDLLPVNMKYVAGTGMVTDAAGDSVWVDPQIDVEEERQLLTFNVLEDAEALMHGEKIVIDMVVETAKNAFNLAGAVNVANVNAPEDDNPENDQDEATVIVKPVATLKTTKEAIGEFKVGSTGEYLITVENLGPTDAPGPFYVVDELPEGLSYVSSPQEHTLGGNAAGNAGDAGDDGQSTVIWEIADGLLSDESVSFTLIVDIDRAAYPSVTNVVNVESPETELTEDSILTDTAEVEVVLEGTDEDGGDIPDGGSDGDGATGGTNSVPLISTTGANVPYLVLTIGFAMLAGGTILLLRNRRSLITAGSDEQSDDQDS